MFTLTDPDVGATSPSPAPLPRPRETAGGGDAAEDEDSGSFDLRRAVAAAATAVFEPTGLSLARELLGAWSLEALAATADASASAVARCRLRIAWNSSKVRDTIYEPAGLWLHLVMMLSGYIAYRQRSFLCCYRPSAPLIPPRTFSGWPIDLDVKYDQAAATRQVMRRIQQPL